MGRRSRLAAACAEGLTRLADTAIAPILAEWINGATGAAAPGEIPLLFLSGAQGSGKSTALRQAIELLGAPVAGASIDDFYLTRAERAALARQTSPLFATRGPPGTHDLGLLAETISALRAARGGSHTRLPVFDKLADDRAPASAWPLFAGRPAAIVIEGWLMGALPDRSSLAGPPINAVEAEDESGAWRERQEAELAGPYAALWDRADGFFHIIAPGFDTVLGWRLQQEEGLWQAKGMPMPEARAEWVARFIGHYERITRRMMEGARRAGTNCFIDDQRRPIGVQGRSDGAN